MRAQKWFGINKFHRDEKMNGVLCLHFNQLSIYVCYQEDGTISESRRDKDRLDRKRGASVEASKESGSTKSPIAKRYKYNLMELNLELSLEFI